MRSQSAFITRGPRMPGGLIRKWTFLSVSALLALLLIPSALLGDEYSKKQHYSVRMFSYGTLTVDTRTGDLEIDGWDNPQLSIDAEKVVRAGSATKAAKLYDKVGIRLQGRDHKVRLTTVYPARRLWRPFRDESKLSVNFTIKMPYDANLALKCVDGDVTVSGISGSEFLKVNYGDVEVDVPSVYRLRLFEAHSWLGYVQSDLHGMPVDGAGFGKRVSFRNHYGNQVIIVSVGMGGIFIYGEQD